MNDEEYEELFPLLSRENYKEYENDCRFFFEDPEECLAFISRKKKIWDDDVGFAYEQCKDHLTESCCKKLAGTNDEAYQYCIEKISHNKNPLLLYIMIFFISIIVCFCIINVIF